MGEKGEDLDIGPTHALMSIPEAERDEWCIGCIKALAEAAEKVMNTKPKLKQARAVKAFMKDLRDKRDDLLPVFFYTIKPQFRDTFVDFLEKLMGLKDEDITGIKGE